MVGAGCLKGGPQVFCLMRAGLGAFDDKAEFLELKVHFCTSFFSQTHLYQKNEWHK